MSSNENKKRSISEMNEELKQSNGTIYINTDSIDCPPNKKMKLNENTSINEWQIKYDAYKLINGKHSEESRKIFEEKLKAIEKIKMEYAAKGKAVDDKYQDKVTKARAALIKAANNSNKKYCEICYQIEGCKTYELDIKHCEGCQTTACGDCYAVCDSCEDCNEIVCQDCLDNIPSDMTCPIMCDYCDTNYHYKYCRCGR
eukprot:446621_1